MTKVTATVAEEIRGARASGLAAREIATLLGIHIRTVFRTLSGENCRYEKEPIAKRFERKVQRGARGACHEWLATKNRAGYGVFGIWKDGSSTTVLAHRFAFELAGGEIPAGLQVRHKCDNPGCCNPAHLEVGTHQDNMRDMVERNRVGYGTVTGERGYNQLTAAKVKAIRRAHASGATQASLADKYGVSGPTIHHVVHRKRWKHVL